MTIEVLDVARREFDEAFIYYSSKGEVLGEAFRDSVRSQVLRIQEHPDAWIADPSGHPKMPWTPIPV
jgi:hypothetical protein